MTREAMQKLAGNQGGGFRLLPLFVGVLLIIVLTAYPPLLADRSGAADHVAALFFLWSMCAGLVSGVGFVPLAWLPRVTLSGSACFLAVLLAVARVASH